MSTLLMVGLGRMGANMVKRLLHGGHTCWVYDKDPAAVARLVSDGALALPSLSELRDRLQKPRIVWLMIPAGIVASAVSELSSLLEPEDILVDGGNSNYRDAIERARILKAREIRFVDVGTSGGIWGLENGYCLMVGGGEKDFTQLEPVLKALAPGGDSLSGKPEHLGYLHCGPPGAGHFVKMVHNGIEYGLMAAYAEGLNILRHASIGKHESEASAELAPLRNPEAFAYDLPIEKITELWRHGSVVQSWLLDLLSAALAKDPNLEALRGTVADSGEGRWTINAAVDTGVPAPVLSAALFSRFSSRGEDNFANKVLSAMRREFGGHVEKSHQPGDNV